MSAQTSAAPAANAESIEFWQRIMVNKYRLFRPILTGATARFARRAFALSKPTRGESVLDIGCGFGETTLTLAELIGEGGAAVGVDCCPTFLAVAEQDAVRAGVKNATFRCADAQEDELPASDYVFSAFGVMFFDQPVQALRNLRRAASGGRATFLVWATKTQNPWLTLSLDACERVLPPVPEGAASCGPGPFSMSDPDVIRAQLEAAGYRGIETKLLVESVLVGADVERAIDFQMQLGPAGQRVRESGILGTPAEHGLRDWLRQTMSPHLRPGGIHLPAAAWLVTARG